MSENFSTLENESSPSSEFLREEIAKIKAELNELKNLKEGNSRSTKTAVKRKPVKRRAAVKRKTAAKRKPVKRRAAVKRKTIRRK
ncbi:MAG: hypothetical protein ACE5DL_04175 [Nitrosopumilaceae archaeon]